MRIMLRRLWREDEGVTAIEYGLMAGLIVLAIVGGVGALGTSVQSMYESIETQVSGAMP